MSETNLPASPEFRATKPTPPALVWFAIAVLGVISVLTLMAGLSRKPGVALATVLGNVILMIGLGLGHKWAYVLLIALSALGAAFAFAKSGVHGLSVLLGNAVVVTPVLMSTRFFFPNHQQKDLPGNS